MPASKSPQSGSGAPRTPARRRPLAPMGWSSPQRWSVLAASAGSILATALLLFAGL